MNTDDEIEAAYDRGREAGVDSCEPQIEDLRAEIQTLQSRLDGVLKWFADNRTGMFSDQEAELEKLLHSVGVERCGRFSCELRKGHDGLCGVGETCGHERLERRGDGSRWCLDCKVELPRASVVERQEPYSVAEKLALREMTRIEERQSGRKPGEPLKIRRPTDEQ